MEIIAKKTDKTAVFVVDVIMGVFCLALGVVLCVLCVKAEDFRTIFEENDITAIVILAIAFAICFLGGLWLIGRFLLHRKMPEVLIEADRGKLYIHGKNERIMTFEELEGASILAGTQSLFVKLFQGNYGTLVIEPLRGRNVKLHYVDNVSEVPARIAALIKRG